MPVGQTTTTLLAAAKAAGKPLRQYDRDSQRSRLYKAEHGALRGNMPRLSQREADALVKRIRTSAYVLKHYGDPGEIRVVISTRRTRKSVADVYRGQIVLAAGWGQGLDVIVHEIAHMYASPAGDPGHGWLFCHIYLDFVRKFIGQEAYTALRNSFKLYRVRHTPPRARKAMSPEQRAAASDRMAKARAARAASSIEPHVIAIPRNTYNRGVQWALLEGSTVPKGGWLPTTFHAFDFYGELRSNVFVRKTDAGIAKALAAVRTWPGAKEAMAVPVSQIVAAGRSIAPDWDPSR